MFWRWQAELLRRFEVRLLKSVPLVVVLSPEDEALLRAEGLSNVTVIPPPMATVSKPVPSAKLGAACRVIFVGRMGDPVHRKAFFRFTNLIWPLVRARVEVIFAGGQPDRDIQMRAKEAGITVLSHLSNGEMEELIEQSDISIAPVEQGTGIKIKMLETMARGKAVVGFPNAFRGICVEHNRHALIAQTDEEFADMLSLLASDEGLRRRLGEAARELIDDAFNHKSLGSKLLEAYSIIQSTPRVVMPHQNSNQDRAFLR
jgi:glycosyltransferase involved in cell wall biosynthesis